MSHAYGAVRFNGGKILFFEYNGTVDVCIPNLYETEQEVGDNWRNHPEILWERCEHDEPVRIMDTYGGGKSWEGHACRLCMRITEGFNPYYEDDGTADGEPEWSPFKD